MILSHEIAQLTLPIKAPSTAAPSLDEFAGMVKSLNPQPSRNQWNKLMLEMAKNNSKETP
jgi:hypothetical protein